MQRRAPLRGAEAESATGGCGSVAARGPQREPSEMGLNPVSKLFGGGSKGTTDSKPDAPAANRTASSASGASGSSRSAGTAPPLENMTSSGYSSDVGNKKMSITSSLVPHHEGQSEVHTLYDTSEGWELGRGGCGTITVVTKRSTGEKFAMKRVALDGLEDTSLSELRQEIEIQVDAAPESSRCISSPMSTGLSFPHSFRDLVSLCSVVGVGTD